MATNELKTRIKHAYKTESDWTSSNPVLLKGEVAYSSDKNNKYKVGDGTHKWSDLAYAIPVTKSDIGLGNVDNTADSAKSVKYATSAGSATKVNGHTVNSDVPSGAKFTDTDTKVTNTLATTTKAYVTGTTSASTNTGTQVFDTGVYLDTTAGRLHVTSIGVGNGIMSYDSTKKCIVISVS